MAQEVSRRPLPVETQVRSQASQCEIGGGPSGAGTGFSPEYSSFPLSVSFHRCSVLILVYMLLLPEKQMGEAWEPGKKAMLVGNLGALCRQVPSRSRHNADNY